ncbi:MAG: 3-carboxy-cis,cis-muconate cycloisomerase [Yoonia sp.]|uniref:3-carboxy-cis,cis-muconate cycloisomerase n=1 Tax=Yoonia sp. TaxID=2212373 RepID=UPI00273FCEAF|nr:3-carboxy-cis,cis-muconate cycloisomerase [Yoonia sp.]MDP5085574.1 3-carboxy-cis,cis-muconate cycloisomerase [Yoonia sp.]
MGPFDHPWLGCLLGDAQAASIWGPDQQIRHMLTFEASFTRALGAVGAIPLEQANRVAELIDGFQPDLVALNTATARDGVPVPELVAQLRKAAGSDAQAVHHGATSQDVMDTALALTIRSFNDLAADRLTTVATGFDALLDRFGARTIMGRTRMQAALPIRFADRLDTWALPLQRHAHRLAQMRPALEALQLGGAVGDRAGLAPHGDAIAARMATLLGLSNPAKATHAMRDHIADYASLLSLITGSLGKMGQDICLMAQQGIEDIGLDGGGGSSAMPHKQNPVLAELLVSNAAFNATQLSGMHHALVHEQERSGAAWVLEWMILPQMAQVTARSLSAAIDLIGRIHRIG